MPGRAEQVRGEHQRGLGPAGPWRPGVADQQHPHGSAGFRVEGEHGGHPGPAAPRQVGQQRRPVGERHDVRDQLLADVLLEDVHGWPVPFQQGLAETVAWYRDNRWWWEKIKSGEYSEYYQRQYGNRAVLTK